MIKAKVKIKKTEKPKAVKKVKPVKSEEEPSQEKYLKAEGRRKTSVARVRLFTLGEKTFSINGKQINLYFPIFDLQEIVKSALKLMKCDDKFRI